MGSFDTRDHYSAKVGVIGIRDPRWTIVLNGIMSTLKGQTMTYNKALGLEMIYTMTLHRTQTFIPTSSSTLRHLGYGPSHPDSEVWEALVGGRSCVSTY